MKIAFILFCIFLLTVCKAQQIENIIIITTDGLRWQEVFKGLDSAIANNKKFNEDDSAYLFKKYWDISEIERRKTIFLYQLGLRHK